MHPICAATLLFAAVGFADDPPLEREGEKLPIVAMPEGSIPQPENAPEPRLLETAYVPETEVAVEGEFKVANPKEFRPGRIYVRFGVVRMNGGWVTAGTHVGGRAVKVKEGLYRYRTVIKTPPRTRIYNIEVYNYNHDRGKVSRELISTARVDVDEDVE